MFYVNVNKWKGDKVKKQNNYKKLISNLLVVALLTQIVGCYSYQEITKEEFTQAEKYTDLQLRTKSQSIYKFDEGSYTVMEDSIYGSGIKKLKHSNKRFEDYTGSVYLEDIESFEFDKFDTVITVLAIAAGVGVIVSILTHEYKVTH